MYITYADLIQLMIFIVALWVCVNRSSGERIAATTHNSDGCY